MRGLVFVISGPSGSGKTTLAERLLKERKLKNLLAKSVSATTRPKRSKERQGRDYFFFKQDTFQKALRAKKFLEWTKYLGYYYATPRSFLEGQLKKGVNLLLCLDLRGARQIKKLYPHNAVTVFVKPPSLSALRERIEKRCSRTKKEEVSRRLRLAKKELAGVKEYDYSLVNNKLDPTVKALGRIVLKQIQKKASED
jgi:guanylate kinase